MEGRHCIRAGCEPTRYVVPQFEYANAGDACSITGGLVYRGRRMPALRGHYLFSDYCAGFLRSFRFDGQAVHDVVEHAAATRDLPGRVVSFGTDADGEVLVVSFGGIHRVVPAT